MRLTREKKKINKNKSLIVEKGNINNKLENNYLQEIKRKINNNNLMKEKIREKNLKDLYGSKHFKSNTNIYNYKNNNKIRDELNSQIQKNTEKNITYTKNKTISLNANNNINIGNNINIQIIFIRIIIKKIILKII